MISRSIFILIVAVLSFDVQGQGIVSSATRDVFLPEKYVACLLKHQDTTICNKIAIPFTAIMMNGEHSTLQMHDGSFVEVSPILQSSGKLEFGNIYLNQQVNTLPVKEYEHSTFLISQINDRQILLEIKNEDRIDSIIYVNSINDYKFEFPQKSYFKLFITGKYKIRTTSNIDLGKELIIKLDGELLQDGQLGSYILLKYMDVEGSDGNKYKLITFNTQKNSRLDLAMRYDNERNVWLAYRYIYSDNKVNLDSKPLFEMYRME